MKPIGNQKPTLCLLIAFLLRFSGTNCQKPDFVLVVDVWDSKIVSQAAQNVLANIKKPDDKFVYDVVVFSENGTQQVVDKVKSLIENGAALVADMTCKGLIPVRSVAHSVGVPYILVKSITAAMVQSVSDYLEEMGARDAAFIFNDRSSFEGAFCYAIDHVTIQVLLVDGLTRTNLLKLKSLPSRYSHYAVFGNSFENNDFLREADENGLMLGDSRWLSFLQNNGPNNFRSKRNGLSIAKTDETSLCRLTGRNLTCNSCPSGNCLSGKDTRMAYFQHIFGTFGNVVTKEAAPQITLQSIKEVFIKHKSPVIWDQADLIPNLQVGFSVESNFAETPVAKWNQNISLSIAPTAFQSRVRRKLRIGSIINPPFLFPIYDRNGGMTYTGLYMDILKRLQDDLEFDYELVFPDDNSFGIRNHSDNTWNGLIGQLVRGETDAIFASLSMTSERAEVIDFVTPYFDQAGIGILGRKPQRQQSLFKFMAVLSPEVWWAILGAIFIASIAIWFVDRQSPFSGRRKSNCNKYRRFSLKESFWFSLTSLTPQGGGEVPTSFSGRVLVASYWLFVVLILATFTANLAALLTVERMQVQVNSLDEMVREANFRYTVLANSFTYQYFHNMAMAETELFNAWKNISLKSGGDYSKYRVWDYPIKEQYRQILKNIEIVGLAKDVDEGVKRVMDDTKGRFAFMVDISMVRYRLFQDCDFTMIGDVFAEHPYALAVTKGSSLLVELGNKVSKLQRERFFEDRMSSYMNSSKLRRCNQNSDHLGLFELGGVFIALSAGLVISLLALALEVKTNKQVTLVEPEPVRMPEMLALPPVNRVDHRIEHPVRTREIGINTHKCKPEPGCFGRDFHSQALPW